MSNLKAYLAEKYMSGPKADAILSRVATKKKRKAKDSNSSRSNGGMNIQDDDRGLGEETREDVDDISEAVVASDRGFKKRRLATMNEGSSWVTVQEGLASATLQERSPSPAIDEQPVVVETTPFVGGLVSTQRLKNVLPQHKVTRMEEATAEEIARAQETVYRDATGKKIDTKAARAEATRLKREREEKEAQKMEWGKGLIQREEQEKKRAELQKQKGKGFARYADDKDLNEELKAKELWNDPAAAFLTKKRSKGPKKPEYSGPPPPPNRFGIKPGYRWDGVDRGNGFEKKLFQTQNLKKRKGLESYQWSVDDM